MEVTAKPTVLTTMIHTVEQLRGIRISLIVVAAFFIGCNAQQEADPDGPDKEPKIGASGITSVNDVIACTNMANDMIEWYDPQVADWNNTSARKWFWKPNPDHGWRNEEVSAWNNGDPMDVKLRNASFWPGASQVFIAVSAQYVTVASYPEGEKKWGTIVPEGPDQALRQGEVLPNGNIAVTSTRGNWIRVYAASQGPENNIFGEASLTGASGLLWDPMNDVLWVIGTNYLTAYTIQGTTASPTLSEVTDKRHPLTSPGLDLTAYDGNPHKLWISQEDGVYVYDKVTKVLTAAPGATNRAQVIAISNHPGGRICQARAKNDCTSDNACTATVDLYSYSGASSERRTKSDAAFSSAQYFRADYQDPAEYRIATYNIRRIANEEKPEREWTVRRPLVKDMITQYSFDIFGIQEPLGEQIDDMVEDLPIYSRFGVSDHGDYAYQHQDIFYKTSRFTLLEDGHFWLAPEGPTSVPADTRPWDNQYHACVVTWGKFQDASTGFQFYVFNAHFDPGGAVAKQESANLVLSRIPEIAGSSPVIFMGDLNTNQDTEPYRTLNNSELLQESWDIAVTKTPDSRQTGNWWDPNWDYNSQIDHVFVTAHWNVVRRHVLWDTYNGVFPSDHCPVLTFMNPE